MKVQNLPKENEAVSRHRFHSINTKRSIYPISAHLEVRK